MNRQVRPIWLSQCDRWLSAIGRGLRALAMLLLAVMTILIALQVASRNVFDIGLPWADELARFTGLGVVFFTVPLLQYNGRHIAVDMLSSRLTGLSGRILRLLNEAMMLAFCILLLLGFADFFKRAAFFSTPATGMPNWLFYSPALIGIIACTLICVLRMAKYCTDRNSSYSNTSTAAGEESV